MLVIKCVDVRHLVILEGLIFSVWVAYIDSTLNQCQRINSCHCGVHANYFTVDHYFVAVDTMNSLVEDIEHRMQEPGAEADAAEIYMLKREVLFLRRNIAPAREVLGQLVRQEDENELISSAVDVYFRDVHDHVVQVNESLETLREMLVSLIDVYHSLQSSRLNEVMRILTVISTIFMPLTFIAGIYGMNFDNMPELHARFGYVACLLVMLITGVAMFFYMKRRKWL